MHEAGRAEDVSPSEALFRRHGASHRGVKNAPEIVLSGSGDLHRRMPARRQNSGVEGTVQRGGCVMDGIGIGKGDGVTDCNPESRRNEPHPLDLNRVTGSMGGQRKREHGECKDNAQ